jgi:hypothetical protein
MDEKIINEAVEETEAPKEAVSADAEAPVAVEEEYYEMSGLTEAQRKRRDIFDKITTGILIFLMTSPILILAYIFIWFIINITSR